MSRRPKKAMKHSAVDKPNAQMDFECIRLTSGLSLRCKHLAICPGRPAVLFWPSALRSHTVVRRTLFADLAMVARHTLWPHPHQRPYTLTYNSPSRPMQHRLRRTSSNAILVLHPRDGILRASPARRNLYGSRSVGAGFRCPSAGVRLVPHTSLQRMCSAPPNEYMLAFCSGDKTLPAKIRTRHLQLLGSKSRRRWTVTSA